MADLGSLVEQEQREHNLLHAYPLNERLSVEPLIRPAVAYIQSLDGIVDRVQSILDSTFGDKCQRCAVILSTLSRSRGERAQCDGMHVIFWVDGSQISIVANGPDYVLDFRRQLIPACDPILLGM